MSLCLLVFYHLFFFNYPAPTEIYTLSLHDALPICRAAGWQPSVRTAKASTADAWASRRWAVQPEWVSGATSLTRSEEHTSELQSLAYLVCRLLLEKKKTK